MFFSPYKTRLVARTLSAALIWCGLQSSVAQAAFISTEALTETTVAQDAHADLNRVLARDEIRQQLLSYGVSPEQITARIAALTDEEARQLSQQIADLPAGGSALGTIVLIFLVLIVTDLLGATDVFPAIRPL